METVRVVCPKCRVELDVKNRLNVEQKLIKCPNCGYEILPESKSYKFIEDSFKKIKSMIK